MELSSPCLCGARPGILWALGGSSTSDFTRAEVRTRRASRHGLPKPTFYSQGSGGHVPVLTQQVRDL